MGASILLKIVLLFPLLVPAAFAALPSSYGPYYVNGVAYYVVNGSNPSLNTGTAVCAAAGLKCVGYTDKTTAVCSAVHPSAAVVQSVNGSSTGYYCNGPPQTGECSFRYNTCDICPACNVNANCNFTVSGLFRQMFVQCSGVTPTGAMAHRINFAAWFASILAALNKHKSHLFGYGPPPSPTGTSAGGYLCPQACYLYSGGGNGWSGPSPINCNVNQSEVWQPLSKCTGFQTDVGQGQVACSCNPDPTWPIACPSSCNASSQIACIISPLDIGKSNIPCVGLAQGTNIDCKCAWENGQWAYGAAYGIR